VVSACVDAFNARDLDRRVVATSTLRSGQAGLASLDAVHRLAGEQTAAARQHLSNPDLPERLGVGLARGVIQGVP